MTSSLDGFSFGYFIGGQVWVSKGGAQSGQVLRGGSVRLPPSILRSSSSVRFFRVSWLSTSFLAVFFISSPFCNASKDGGQFFTCRLAVHIQDRLNEQECCNDRLQPGAIALQLSSSKF